MGIFNKISLGAVVVILITNPASGQFIMDAIEKGFQLVFMYGSPINFAATGVVLAWILWNMWTSRTKTVIPPKTKKTKRDGMKYEVA